MLQKLTQYHYYCTLPGLLLLCSYFPAFLHKMFLADCTEIQVFLWKGNALRLWLFGSWQHAIL